MELFALTIAPRIGEEPINSANASIAYWEQRRLIHRMLNRACSQFKMFPELTDAGHLHWHGFVEVIDFHKWFMQVCPTFSKKLGHIKVKKIFNLSGWIKYSAEEIDKTKELFKDLLEDNEKVYIDSDVKLPRKRTKGAIEIPHIKTLLDYGFTIDG